MSDKYNKKISVMIAYVCNPFLPVLQKRLYNKYWKNEVDELVINVNGRNDLIRNWIIDLWKNEDKVKYIEGIPREMRQGQAFDSLYPHISDNIDIVMTMDSDNFIYNKKIIMFFKNMLVDGYDAVGSKGYHAYPGSVSKIALGRYGTVRLNPFMSLWWKKNIDKIPDLTFRTYGYEKGDTFEPLGKIPEEGWMDVMCRFSLQYFQIASKYLVIPPTREDQYVHVAALSSLYRLLFRSLEDENTQKFTKSDSSKQRLYYMAWQNVIYELTKNEVLLEEYKKEWERGYWSEIDRMSLKREDIKRLTDETMQKYKHVFK